jgi:toxin ParE1/3/4
VDVKFHPQAKQELLHAVIWYETKADDLGALFFQEIGRGLEAIMQLPQAWPMSGNQFRRFLLNRFPYAICYRVEGAYVMVYAVAHHKQRSNYWRRRKFI